MRNSTTYLSVERDDPMEREKRDYYSKREHSWGQKSLGGERGGAPAFGR